MELTNPLSAAVDFVGGAQPNTVKQHIKDWIDGNMYYADQNYVWRIGITTAENIVKIEANIRQDIQCKHWKYWRTESFKEAMVIMRELNCYPFVFKSMHNQYLGKGPYLFAYKTFIPQKSLFYHTLHS
jgi:hypothetical protein